VEFLVRFPGGRKVNVQRSSLNASDILLNGLQRPWNRQSVVKK